MTQFNKPPKIANWILKHILPEKDFLVLDGDFEESYNDLYVEKGGLLARFWYWKQVLISTSPFLHYSIERGFAMLKNYMNVAIRNIKRNKTYTAINISGMALAIACCILVFIFINYEHSFDTFHEYHDSIYELILEFDTNRGKDYVARTPLPLANTIQELFPDVENASRLAIDETQVKTGDRVINRKIALVDESFFSIFSFDLLSGNESTVFIDEQSIVISNKMAVEVFGDEDPIGKTITLTLGTIGFEHEYVTFTIAGILADIPDNSSIQFDLLVSFTNHRHWTETDWYKGITDWNKFTTTAFIKVKPETDPVVLESKFPNIKNEYGSDYVMMSLTQPKFKGKVTLLPLTEIHLTQGVRHPDWPEPGNKLYSYVLAGIAFLIIFIASINFMNISIGILQKRAKEVGVRRMLGAKKRQIAKQYLTETIVLSFLALFAGIVFAQLFLPVFNQLVSKNLSISLLSHISGLGFLIGLVFFVAILSGIYPIMLVSRFAFIRIFKGCEIAKGNNILTKALVSTQFALSIILIVCAGIMNGQINYLKNLDLGYNGEQVLTISFSISQPQESIQAYKNAIFQHHSVITASASYGSIYSPMTSMWEENGKWVKSLYIEADANYFATMGLRLLEGRFLSQKSLYDENNSVMVNETLAKSFAPRSAIGQSVYVGAQKLTIVGVLMDFHFRSFATEIEPLSISLHKTSTEKQNFLSVKFSAKNVEQLLNHLRSEWIKIAPNDPFVYQFLDEQVAMQYSSQQRWSKIIGIAMTIAISIAIMGLIGITSISISRRKREIGIRKVLGAKVISVVNLFSTDFLKLLVVANIIAWPVAYYAMDRWLQSFAYKVLLTGNHFLYPALLTLTLGILTISILATKAGSTNPVLTLNKE